MPNIHPNLLRVFVGIGLLLILATVISYWLLPTLKKGKNFGELQLRVRSWWAMVAVFVVAVSFGKIVTYIAFASLSFFALRELYSLLGFREDDRKAMIWAYLAVPIQYYLAYIDWYGAYIIFIPVIMFLWLPLRFILIGQTAGVVRSMTIMQWILMLTVFGISHLAYMLNLNDKPGFDVGPKGLLIFLVFMTEINDVFQYTWGKMFGKHRITPTISPNKTWEGFVGGLLSTAALGYFLSPIITPFSPMAGFFIAMLIGFAGFIGDVVVSSIKRDIGIKDTGSIIPGHGGILDRIDSLSYTAPAFFHLVYYLYY